MRKFIVHDRPHVADPTLVQPVIDITDPHNPIYYSDASELKRVVDELHDYLTHQAGYLKGGWDTAKVLGFTPDEVIKKQREQMEKS